MKTLPKTRMMKKKLKAFYFLMKNILKKTIILLQRKFQPNFHQKLFDFPLSVKNM